MLYNVGQYDWEKIITKRYSIYDIFSFYIGYRFKVGQPFNSPLRTDNNPSFGIFATLEGDLLYKDFGTGESGDWIKFIQTKYNLPYRWAVIRVFLDLIISNIKMSEGTVNPNIHYYKKNTSIGLKLASIRQQDIDYWKQFNISTDILSLYNVVPVSMVWVDGVQVMNRNGNDLIFAYLINKRIKVYCPLAIKKKKWLGNSDSSCIFGLEQLPNRGELLIITKALKDVMTLYSFGYNSIAGNSETTLLKESIINNLKERFDKIIVLLDNDSPGIEAAEKYKEKYGLDYIIIPLKYGTKDISDFVKKYKDHKWITQKIKNLLINEK